MPLFLSLSLAVGKIAVMQMKLIQPPFSLDVEYSTLRTHATADGTNTQMPERQSRLQQAFFGGISMLGQSKVGDNEEAMKSIVSSAGCTLQAFTASMCLGGESRLSLSRALVRMHISCV
jgi:hypothetical protein